MKELHAQIVSRDQAKYLGMKYYFTGKPCGKGGVGYRKVVNHNCVCDTCSVRLRNESRKWYCDNRGHALKYAKEYYQNNSTSVREYNKNYYWSNKEHCQQRASKYYIDNQERLLDYSRKWRSENPEHRKTRYWENREEELASQRDRRKKDPGYRRRHYVENKNQYYAALHNRRAAKLNRTLSFREDLTQFVMQESAQQARDMENIFGIKFHVDHMIPLQGEGVSGLHVWYNLQVIPATLNLSKGTRMELTRRLEWLGLLA